MSANTPTAQKITGWLWEHDRELFDAFGRAGAFRGLFDMGSAEWKHCEVPEKRALLRRLWALGVPPHVVRAAAAEVIEAYGYGTLDARFSVLEATAAIFDDSLVKAAP